MKTERIPFDFSLWGQEGIEVWHVDGRKAVYVGELSNGNLLIHWGDKEYGTYGVYYPTIYMTRQVKQKTIREIIKECRMEVYGGMFSEAISDHEEKYYRLFLEKAKEGGLI